MLFNLLLPNILWYCVLRKRLFCCIYTCIYFTPRPQFPFPPLSQSFSRPPILFSPLYPLCFCLEKAGLLWVSTKHGVSSCSQTKHLPCTKAGQGNTPRMRGRVPKAPAPTVRSPYGWRGWEQDELGRGRVLRETTEIWGYHSDKLETYCNKNSQESVRVTLPKTPSSNEIYRTWTGHFL